MSDTPTAADPTQPNWEPQPAAAQLVRQLVEAFCYECSLAGQLKKRLLNETGTRLVDWIDYFAYEGDGEFEQQLRDCGFESHSDGARTVFEHPGGIFPRFVLDDHPPQRMALKVDSVADFLFSHWRDDSTPIEGRPLGPMRRARLTDEGGHQLWVVERRGHRGYDPPEVSDSQIAAAVRHAEAFRRRRRAFADDRLGFDHLEKLIAAACLDLGTDWACALFFAAERNYWQVWNLPARIQRSRQEALGMGWANHDHHTYRSSRRHFSRLIELLEKLGMRCRERFYAGAEAGWGAQVLEQPAAGIVVFADVDLAPDEVSGDFAHQPLPERDAYGTVGVWCKLFGEAVLHAGMHHLECQFDFAAAREQLPAVGVPVMEPFTDLPHLKQCFTKADMWQVEPQRLEAAIRDGAVEDWQAEQLREAGAPGSHLEILERNEGFKGFNQEGVSDIIRRTDPRGGEG